MYDIFTTSTSPRYVHTFPTILPVANLRSSRIPRNNSAQREPTCLTIPTVLALKPTWLEPGQTISKFIISYPLILQHVFHFPEPLSPLFIYIIRLTVQDIFGTCSNFEIHLVLSSFRPGVASLHTCFQHFCVPKPRSTDHTVSVPCHTMRWQALTDCY